MGTQRTYLTISESISFGEFIQSDFRRFLKQKEARFKLESNMVDFIPWTQSFRIVTKQDMRIFRKLYFDHGIRDFNNVSKILQVYDSD